MIETTFANAINQAIYDSLESDKKVLCLGLGTTDPKGVFGTTLGLKEKFGKDRVFDIPTSENAITGVCAGLGIAGYKPILTHQRLDFALLSLDQIINNAAKIHYMYGGNLSCPIVIRMIIGRGWGQGPTHSQNLQALFSGIPGLIVAMPSTAQDAYSQLRACIDNPNPCIFLEHRWLHNSKGQISKNYSQEDLIKQRIMNKGSDYTIVATGYMVLEALRAYDILQKNYGLSGDIISFRNYNPDLISEITESVSRTKKIIFADTSQRKLSIGNLILFELRNQTKLKGIEALTLTMPDVPEPTSKFLTKNLYPSYKDLTKKVVRLVNKNLSLESILFEENHSHDIPGKWFKGPF